MVENDVPTIVYVVLQAWYHPLVQDMRLKEILGIYTDKEKARDRVAKELDDDTTPAALRYWCWWEEHALIP